MLLIFGSLQAAAPEARKIRVVLERMQKGAWTQVEPGLVLNAGDQVRFRVTTNFDGYLYVVNYGTSGKYSVLFPSTDAGSDNHIKATEMHRVPDADAVFRISGPAGQEIVYWMMSPIPLPGNEGIPIPDRPKTPVILLPRCDDSLMRSRGECIDASAGARDLDTPSPEELQAAGKPSDLTIVREGKNSLIAANDGSTGPMIYEFRLAHK